MTTAPTRRPPLLVHRAIICCWAPVFVYLLLLACRVDPGCGGRNDIWAPVLIICSLLSSMIFALVATILRLVRCRPPITYGVAAFGGFVPLVLLFLMLHFR